jgi:hypothetical protein
MLDKGVKLRRHLIKTRNKKIAPNKQTLISLQSRMIFKNSTLHPNSRVSKVEAKLLKKVKQ